MRYLHPVAAHETFVASGTYRYFTPDGPSGMVEHWTVHELPDGAWFVRVDRDGRDYDGRFELLEGWRSPDGAVERFDVRAYGVPGDPFMQVRATYTIDNGTLYVGRTLGTDERQQQEIPLPDAYTLQPAAYLFTGWALPTLAANPEHVIVTNRRFSTDADTAFSAQLTPCRVTKHGADTVQGVGQSVSVTHYTVERDGGPVEHYWIDADATLRQGEGPGFRVVLERYSHRP